jgi:hypothetical protein
VPLPAALENWAGGGPGGVPARQPG